MNRWLLSGGLLLLLLLLLLFASGEAPAVSAAPAAPAAIQRPLDPIILHGAQLPDWLTLPLDQLFLYAYHPATGWRQIPWQFDEKSQGVYVASEDGRLDADDELVFMARDCGQRASPSQWIADADARNHQRYEITVTDPLHPDQHCWVYLYRSTTQQKTNTRDYVDYEGYTAATESYHLTVQKKQLIAADLTFFQNHEDVLDRTKVRVKQGTLFIDEDDLVPNDPNTDWYKIRDGQVRTIIQFIAYDPDTNKQTILLTLLNYESLFHEQVTFDLSDLTATLEMFRYSADLTSAIAGGTYYDANTPAGVAVDGMEDDVAVAPFSPWNQISHPSLGSIIQIIDAASMGGTQQTYYKDDKRYDGKDTGDGRSYADTGLLIKKGSANLAFDVWYYVLPPGQPNVGAAYADAATHSLRTQTTPQKRSSEPDAIRMYLPMLRAGR